MTPVLKNLGDSEDAIWIFRILNQINQLSQVAPLGISERAEFESAHMRLFELLRECNHARRELIQLVQQHVEDVNAGASVTVIENSHVHIEDDIEPKLNRVVNSFFVTARTVLYHLFGQKENSSKGPHTKSMTEVLTKYNLSFAHIPNDNFDQAAAKYLAFDTSRMARFFQ